MAFQLLRRTQMRTPYLLTVLMTICLISTIYVVPAYMRGLFPGLPDNHPPVANNDTCSLHRGGYLGYLTANDFDPDGDSLTFLVITQPSHGTLSYDYGPNYSRPWYTPASGYSGADSLVYRICDDFNACATATVNINVTNQTPIARDDSYSVHTPGYIGPLRSNDTDPDGDSTTFLVTTQPSHGTLSYDYGPGYDRPWYTPAAGYSGPDFLVYQICDPFNACSQATVNLNDEDKNAGKTSCNLNVGGPINVSNGNMYLQQSDYEITALARIQIVRTYNSSSMHFGLFGRGWSSAYDESIKWYSSQQLRLYLSDGRAIDFTLQSGIYLPSQGDFRGQVIQNGDGTFTLTLKDGAVHQFSKPGKLLWIKDANNNQATLSYDANGRLATVSDPFGRVLTLTTNANSRVTSIADTLGIVATYSYGAGNELLSVTYADNSGFQFTYDANFGLTAATDALGNIVESHAYDTRGRALTSEKQAGVDHYSL